MKLITLLVVRNSGEHFLSNELKSDLGNFQTFVLYEVDRTKSNLKYFIFKEMCYRKRESLTIFFQKVAEMHFVLVFVSVCHFSAKKKDVDNII